MSKHDTNRHRHFQMVFGTASSYTLFRINIWRAFIQLRRDWITFILWGIVSAIVGVLFGVLYWQQAAENWRNLVGLLFSGTCGLWKRRKGRIMT